MRRRARPTDGVRHVALVVRAVEPPSVLAAREAHLQPKRRRVPLRAGRHVARFGSCGGPPQLQNDIAQALRARRGCVARDHPQTVRERRDRGDGAAPVVDRRRAGKHDGGALVEGGNSVRRVVGAREAPPRAERRSREASVVRVPTDVCWCEAPGFWEDDRIVGRLVAKRQALDEDAVQIRAAHAPPRRSRAAREEADASPDDETCKGDTRTRAIICRPPRDDDFGRSQTPSRVLSLSGL